MTCISQQERKRGSNAAIKQLVKAGRLCYICEEKPPALVDEFGGKVCRECRSDYLNVLKALEVTEGYHERSGRRTAPTN
jgi:hypothetical protein